MIRESTVADNKTDQLTKTIMQEYRHYLAQGMSEANSRNQIFLAHHRSPHFHDWAAKLQAMPTSEYQDIEDRFNQSTSPPVNQVKQDNQVMQGKQGSPAGAGKIKAQNPASRTRKGNPGKSPITPTLEEEALLLLEKHKEVLTKCDEWQIGFNSARILRNLWPRMEREGLNPEHLRDVLQEACKRYEIDMPSTWYGFLASWPTIEVPAGQDVFTAAAQKSEAGKPITLDAHALRAGSEYELVLRFAFHAQQIVGDAPIQLPRKRFGEWLDVTPRTITTIVQLLERNAWIKCVNPTYSYTASTAKDYRFVGRCIAGNLIRQSGDPRKTEVS